jgi:hypothetical protein
MDELVAFLPKFCQEGFAPVDRWGGGTKGPDGVVTMPWPEYNAVVKQFVAVASKECWTDFQYVSNLADVKLEDIGEVCRASLAQVKTLLTAFVRGERFCDGHWASMIEQGHIRRLLQRVAELRATDPRQGGPKERGMKKPRGLSPEFLKELQSGFLGPLVERVRKDRSLCLELREDYVNVYYRGGNLLRVSRESDGYTAFFDQDYLQCSEGEASPLLPAARLREGYDLKCWLEAFPAMKEEMDIYFGRHPKEERDVQQMLVRDNNFGGLARSTDYYVCDIEYATEHGRFDMVAVRWPSTPAERKRQSGHRLVLAEVKHGDGALTGQAGLRKHVEDICRHVNDQATVAALKVEMLRVFNQKRELGLIDCEKNLLGFSEELPVPLLILVNHDPDKSKLGEMLRELGKEHTELRVASACLLGYGLYERSMLTVPEALSRMGASV